jgi:hypothetical protein
MVFFFLLVLLLVRSCTHCPWRVRHTAADDKGPTTCWPLVIGNFTLHGWGATETETALVFVSSLSSRINLNLRRPSLVVGKFLTTLQWSGNSW